VFGDSTITLKPLGKSLESVELDAKNIDFQLVTLAGSETPLRVAVGKTKVRVFLPSPLAADQKAEIRFRYSAKPDKGIYFVSPLKSRNKVIRPAQIWTQGEAEETSHWLPSYDFPDDKATTEKIITVQADETVIGNGELRSNTLNKNGTRTFHYSMGEPHSLYLTSFVIGKYDQISDSYRDIPLRYFVYPGQNKKAMQTFRKTKEIMKVFEETTGLKYPFKKYDQTIVARFPFGGMENITATTYSDSEILSVRNKTGRQNALNLVAHELAHSWFGNLVTCRNWAELWTNESFATFMEAVYRERVNGRADYLRKIREDASQYFGYSAASESSKHGLFNTTADPNNDVTMFDPVTYNKGSAIVHTLREELGDKVFWKAVNTYLVRFSYSNVETNDLKTVFEDVSKRDLDWFFEQWVYRIGHPEVSVTNTFDQRTGNLTIEFTQAPVNSENSADLYTLPLEIYVSTSQKAFNRKIILKKRVESFVIPTKIRPQKIEFDRNYKIPIMSLSQARLKTVK
jgi:aminopeptidase N